MTYFADGSPYAYLDPDGALNVGWLHSEHPFPKGDASPLFVSKLVRLCGTPVNMTRGWHRCELCPRDRAIAGPTVIRSAEGDLLLGHGEIRVRGSDGLVYAAPDLIAHYVLAHQYLPPEAFVQAVQDGD